MWAITVLRDHEPSSAVLVQLKMNGHDHVALEERRREMAIEHLLFASLRFLAQQHPALPDELDVSISHLWDRGPEPRDDARVREIATKFVASLRREV